MFKKSYLISTLLIAMLVLAACSSTTDNETGVNEENNSDQEVNKEVANNEESNTEEEQDTVEDESNKEEDTNEADENEDSEQSMDEESDDFSANAKQVDSDEQDFTMQILSDYSLTSEEPGRDSLYSTEDERIFMRIETTPSEEGTYEYFTENIVSLLEAISVDGNSPTELTDENKLPQGEGIEKAVGYTVNTEDGMVSGIVFERNGLIVRLTTFDTAENNHFNNFLKMGETITSK